MITGSKLLNLRLMTTTKQPKKLYALFFTEMWERYGFYTMRAVLVLYMTKILLLSNLHAYTIFGAFTALLYLTPIFGGYLADKLIGFRLAILFGGLFFIVGYCLLAIPQMDFFYVGLALIIVGNGFFKPSVSSIVGELYEAHDARRQGGFSIFYAGINVGSMLPPLVITAVLTLGGWGAVFIMAAVGVLLGLITFFSTVRSQDNLGQRPKLSVGTKAKRYWLLTAIATLAITIGLVFLLEHDTLTDILLFGSGAIFLVYIILKSLTFKNIQRNRLLLCILLILFSIIFWALYQQSGSALTIFTEYNVNRHILIALPFTHYHWQFTVPTYVYQAVNPIVIILFAPILSKLWSYLDQKGLNPSIPAKFALGTLLMGVGFVLIPLVMHYCMNSNGEINQNWINLSYFFQSVGELLLSPVGLSMVTELSPTMMVGMMMGFWFFASAAANALAGIIAGWTTIPSGSNNPLLTNDSYAHVFAYLGITSICAGLIVLLLTPKLKKMLHEPE